MNKTPNTRYQYLFVSIFSAVFLFLAKESNAQLIVSMNLSKTNYITYEPIVATVYNRAGNDIVLGGPKGRGWMSFDVYRDGQLLSPRSVDGGFETMLLKAGRSVTKKLILIDSTQSLITEVIPSMHQFIFHHVALILVPKKK